MNASDFRTLVFPTKSSPWRGVDWVVLTAWTAIAAAEFAIVYRLVSFVVEAAR